MAKRDRATNMKAAAKILGSRGGKKRASVLTSAQMKDIAEQGGAARKKQFKGG